MKSEIILGEYGTEKTYTLAYTGNITWVGNQYLTVPTTKKAIGLFGNVFYNNTVFPCGGIGDTPFYDRGNEWSNPIYNDNNIVIPRSFTGVNVTFTGYVVYED